MYRNDDSIESANTPGAGSYQDMAKDYSIYRCLVIAARYVDDDANLSKGSAIPEMMYDCQVIGGFREGNIIPNCRAVSLAGGNNNFSERVYKASPPMRKGEGLSKQEGDIVYVAYVAGDKNAGIILGGGNHVLDKDSTGATKADGPRLRSQYNGIFTEIDKNGNYTIKRLGGTYNTKTGEFVPNKDADLIITKYEDEKITRTFKTGLSIVEDGAADKISHTFKGGLTLVEDGAADKYTVTTKGGAVLTVDGASKEVSATSGAATITIDSAGKVTISADNIDLGKTVTDLVTKFNELATAYDSHVHQFLDIHVGGPTMSQTQPTVPLLSNVGSLTVKVQD